MAKDTVAGGATQTVELFYGSVYASGYTQAGAATSPGFFTGTSSSQGKNDYGAADLPVLRSAAATAAFV